MDPALKKVLPVALFRFALAASLILACDDLVHLINQWPWDGRVIFLPLPFFAGWIGSLGGIVAQSPLPLLSGVALLFILSLAIAAGWHSSRASGVAALILALYMVVDMTFVTDSLALLILALAATAAFGSPGFDLALPLPGLKMISRPIRPIRPIRYDPRWLALLLLLPVFYGGLWALYRVVHYGSNGPKRAGTAVVAMLLPVLAGWGRTRKWGGLALTALVLVDPLHWFSISAITLLLGVAALIAL